MPPLAWIGALLTLLFATGLMVLGAESPISLLNVTGLAVVMLGTVGAVLVSYPWREVLRVSRLALRIFRHPGSRNEQDIQSLVHLSRLWFSGDPRRVEAALKEVRNPFLRTGVELIIDNTPEQEVLDLMRWRMVRMKARERGEAQMFRTMALYAPAFGMVGTLMGLVNMLGVIDLGDLALVGEHMAVALLSTFYGIVLANLVFKPIAVKLERRTEERLITMNMIMEGVSLLSRRQAPAFIEATLNSFVVQHQDELLDPPESAEASSDGLLGALKRRIVPSQATVVAPAEDAEQRHG
ncbi:motility protein A [Halomonas mongoliensis]|uniref:motility protein A n=1 Tax=Halomonas mongoliensis TaxID=321265 RepID=UPI00403A9174